jgi:hypothetical protein
MNPLDSQPSLLDVPRTKTVPGRLRTNEDWLDRQPELYQEVRDRIMGGDTNVRQLAGEFAPARWNSKTNALGITPDAMRRAIKAMIVEDITLEKFEEIVQTNLSVLRAEMTDKASEIGAGAKSAKDLGAVAMTMKLAGDTKAGMGGAPQPVIRHEHLHVHTTPDELQRRRQAAMREMQMQPTPPQKPAAALAETVTLETDLIDLCPPLKTPLTSI